MIMLPSAITLPHACLYRDSIDSQLVYVDLLNPAPMHGDSATRWLPIPDSLAYLVGEVRFGPDKEGFGDVPGLVAGQRPIPMPWEIVPVFAWYREGDGVQLVARGKTSGFSSSNVVFNGTAPLSAMVSPVLVSAELVCQAQLARARVSGNGLSASIQQSLKDAALGERANWDAPLSEALVDMLTALLDTGKLSLDVKLDASQPNMAQDGLDGLRNQALLEWAHRVQSLMAPDLTLAAPAALVKSRILASPLSLELAWTEGSSVRLRAVRVMKPKEMGRSVPKF
jgi:hypothetical protein